MNHSKMLGRTARVCDFKACTCNEGQAKNRTKDKRLAKRRERRQWRRESNI
jgi:hypothetical protein